MMLLQSPDCSVYAHLSEEGHPEVCTQQPFASMHHFHHFGVGTVQSVVQVRQFLFNNKWHYFNWL